MDKIQAKTCCPPQGGGKVWAIGVTVSQFSKEDSERKDLSVVI
jgi:hypothetical protein